MNGSLFSANSTTGIATGSMLKRAANSHINGLEVLLFAIRGYVYLKPGYAALTRNGLALLLKPGAYDAGAIEILQALFPVHATATDRVASVTFDKNGQPNCDTRKLLGSPGQRRRNRQWQVANGYYARTRGWHPLRLLTLAWLWLAVGGFIAFTTTPAHETTNRVGLGSLSLFFTVLAIFNVACRIHKIAPRGKLARDELKAVRALGKQTPVNKNQHLLPWLWLVHPRPAIACLANLRPDAWWQGSQEELATSLPPLLRAIHRATIYQGQTF